jgi:protein involved in polysaccharide export with SLBB domain
MTFSYETRKTVSDYIRLAGGLTKEADPHGILIIRPNGESRIFKDSIVRLSRRSGREISHRENTALLPGDTIMVLPKVSTSSLLLAQGIADILYKIAITTNTLLRW